ncbi:kinase-like domain-containing protein [Chytriomyces cf. hyalinus JEL632]|nr:kinase-like domain-containing protein [Chytriomyces cf. hyalinus JEL632]
MNNCGATWIKRNTNNGNGIQFPTVDSTGGEVVEDGAPQEQKSPKNVLRATSKVEAPWFERDANDGTAPLPRKKIVKGFKWFGAVLKLFRKKNAPNNREKDITAFFNGSKPLPPKFSERYKLEKAIAQGGFGVVLMVTRLSDSKQVTDLLFAIGALPIEMRFGIQVAVKVIETEKISRTMWLPDPRNPNGDLVPPEVAVLQQLHHPNVIRNVDHVLHGSEWKPSQHSIGPSRSSATLISDDGTQHHLSEPVARKNLAQIALAVQYLQAQGIVHRDIKDVNIVIDSMYKIKLIDFNAPYRGPEAEMCKKNKNKKIKGLGGLPTTAETLKSYLEIPHAFRLDSGWQTQPGCRHVIRRLLDYSPEDRMTVEEVGFLLLPVVVYLLEHPWVKGEVDFYRNKNLSAA